MDYTETLDKALSFLRELELDKALNLFYLLLEEHPRDLDLIHRIYPLEVKRPHLPGFEKICRHIFTIRSSKPEYHKLVLNAYNDFVSNNIANDEFSKQQVFCLLHHLSRSYLHAESNKFAEKIKKHYPTDTKTPGALLHYCEALIANRQLRRARDELKYLLMYYAETPEAINAASRLRIVESQLGS